MRIAHVSPLHESVPPQKYGGTERVVHYLVEEMVRQGHEVTLFASGDSETSAKLVPCCKKALRLHPCKNGPLVQHVLMIERLYRMSSRFDMIHFHIDSMFLPLLRKFKVPHMITFHWRLDVPDFLPLAREFKEIPVSAISRSQRSSRPYMNWAGTVHHGLPVNLLRPGDGSGGYLAFIGRMSPEKGVLEAIEIAFRTGKRLKLAGKINDFEKDFFNEKIRPLLRSPLLEFIGEVNDIEKEEFLGKAEGMLFPIKWPEPFGLVMIEAMACGTPTIAFENGSVPEVIRDGVSGYVVDNVDEAVDRVRRLGEINRVGCRREYEKRFTADKMTNEYLKIYQKLIFQKRFIAEVAKWKKSSKLRVNTMFSPLPH